MPDISFKDNDTLPRAVLDILPNPVLIKNDDLTYIWVNRAFEELFQLKRKDLIGCLDTEVFKERQAVQCAGGDLRVLESGAIDEAYETVFTKDGLSREMITRKSRLTLTDGATFLVGVMHDITDVAQKNRKLEEQGHLLETQAEALRKMAETDVLTGCLNRRALFRMAPARFSDCGNRGALLVLDLDFFKAVNDRFGHQAGDATIVNFTDVVRACIREDALFARIGGEEFAIALPGVTAQNAGSIANRIIERIRTSPLNWEGNQISVTTSIGAVYKAPEEDLEFDRWLALADGVLYEAKELGRDRVVFREATPTVCANDNNKG